MDEIENAVFWRVAHKMQELANIIESLDFQIRDEELYVKQLKTIQDTVSDKPIMMEDISVSIATPEGGKIIQPAFQSGKKYSIPIRKETLSLLISEYERNISFLKEHLSIKRNEFIQIDKVISTITRGV